MCIFLLINLLQLCSEMKGFLLFLRVKNLCDWTYGLMDMYLFAPQFLKSGNLGRNYLRFNCLVI